MGRLEETLRGLQNITDGCRPDMHEPDEQDLTAQVVGTKLDNATGTYISERAIASGYQEFVVILTREAEDGKRQTFRAYQPDLIAPARIAGV